jgi:hypothetical protein
VSKEAALMVVKMMEELVTLLLHIMVNLAKLVGQLAGAIDAPANPKNPELEEASGLGQRRDLQCVNHRALAQRVDDRGVDGVDGRRDRDLGLASTDGQVAGHGSRRLPALAPQEGVQARRIVRELLTVDEVVVRPRRRRRRRRRRSSR